MSVSRPEKDIEDELVEHAREHHGIAYKFVSPGLRSMPDRLVLFHDRHAVQALLREYPMVPLQAARIVRLVREASIRFVEVKAPDEPLRPDQKDTQSRLRRMGFVAVTVDLKPAARTAADPLADIKGLL